jgi:hypothetical protein
MYYILCVSNVIHERTPIVSLLYYYAKMIHMHLHHAAVLLDVSTALYKQRINKEKGSQSPGA